MNVYPDKHLFFLAEDYFHISHSLIGTGTVGKTFMVKHFIMTHLKNFINYGFYTSQVSLYNDCCI